MAIDTGDILTLRGLSANALNVDMLSAMDVSIWDWITVYIGSSAYAGQLSIQGTHDQMDDSSWQTLQMWRPDTLSIANIVLDSVTYAGRTGPRRYPYLRIRMTSYTSGTAVGMVELTRGSRASTMAAQYSIPLINNDGIPLLASAAITANGNSADQANTSCVGGKIYISTGSFGAGESTMAVTLQGKDPISGSYYTILQSAPLSASGFTVLSVYPGLTAAANTVANDVLPPTWRVTWAAANWGTGGSTLGISGAMIG